MDRLKELRRLSEERGFRLIERPNGHCQIVGRRLVNYYVQTGTLYVAGMERGEKGATPLSAVEHAGQNGVTPVRIKREPKPSRSELLRYARTERTDFSLPTWDGTGVPW